jgi:molybdopterin-guanine dinucleotide biosynthesis protein A
MDRTRSKQYPRLNGLVLAGGKSTRMGHDKGLMRWHGKAQRYFLADMLESFCEQIFISCRADQVVKIETEGYHALADSSEAKAQFGAILSAMDAYPDRAWLVVACDLPLIDRSAISHLARRRDPDKLATAYRNPDNGLPEPLAAIWEPSAKQMLIQKFAQGIDCPRKALIRSEGKVKLITPSNQASIMNVNTPEAARAARGLISDYVS